MKMTLAIILLITLVSSVVASVRVDARRMIVATGIERLGTATGFGATAWDTTKDTDGWATLTSGGESVDVLVLNESATVVGGRLAASEAWDDSRVVVVRDDVVVPSGTILTLAAGSIVKFTEGARIVVEDGGAVVAEGAYLAAFDDDGVGGDTDMNGRRDEVIAPYHGWLDDPAVAALSTVKFVDGATNLPTRTYTAGKAYGALPELARDDAMFGGWFTESGGLGQAALPDDVVASGETVLYAHWIPYELGIDPESATVGCLASEGTIVVNANDEWEVSCDFGWVTVSVDGSNVVYSAEENASTDARTATIRVALRRAGDSAPYQRDFTLTQEGMTQLAAPTINPADGTTFIGSSRRVSITNVESGAEIRYTLDGSEPTTTSKLYTKSFNVFDTTVVKAKAFLSGKRASETVSARIVRLQTLAEALDVPLWTVTTDGDAVWTVDVTAGRNGSSCARSGAIGDDQESTLTTTVEGAGTLTFWWKVDCEDDPDYDNWDYLVFEVDGAEVARIDGLTSWQQISFTVKSDTTHTLSWTFCKDYMDDDMTGIEDCGWVDQVSWTPLVSNGTVPLEWIESLGMTSDKVSAAEVANLDPDGDGFTTAQEYIAGTDPTDPDSKLTAHIEIIDGKPVVTYAPDLLSERKYIKLGKVNLSDPNEDWVEVKDGEEENYNFFKVTVDLP